MTTPDDSYDRLHGLDGHTQACGAMTAPDCADLRRLLAEATPGPWEAGERIVWSTADTRDPYVVTDGEAGDGGAFSEVNGALIAAAVNALPHWLDEREAVIRERDEARAKVEAVEAIHGQHHWCADGDGRSDFFMVDGETGTPWPCLTLAALADGGTPVTPFTGRGYTKDPS